MVHQVTVCPACDEPLTEARDGWLVCGSCALEGRTRSDVTPGLTVDHDATLTPPGSLALVTRTRFVQGGTTIPVATLASYTHTVVPEQRTRADRTLPTLLLVASVATLAVGIAVGALRVIGVSALLALVAMVWWSSIHDKVVPELHRLTVVSASGTSRTVEGDERAVEAVHAALDRAVAAAHRPLPS